MTKELSFESGQVQKIFSLHHNMKMGSGAHPATYAIGTGGYFSRGKGLEAQHSPPSGAGVKNGGATPRFPLCR
jgi:hypothetical protein